MTAARKKKRVYCFDTSAFVTLSRTSENVIEMPEALWKRLERMMKEGDLISHQLVFDEIRSGTKKPDFITRWIADKRDYFFPRTDEQIVAVQKIVSKFP